MVLRNEPGATISGAALHLKPQLSISVCVSVSVWMLFSSVSLLSLLLIRVFVGKKSKMKNVCLNGEQTSREEGKEMSSVQPLHFHTDAPTATHRHRQTPTDTDVHSPMPVLALVWC